MNFENLPSLVNQLDSSNCRDICLDLAIEVVDAVDELIGNPDGNAIVDDSEFFGGNLHFQDCPDNQQIQTACDSEDSATNMSLNYSVETSASVPKTSYEPSNSTVSSSKYESLTSSDEESSNTRTSSHSHNGRAQWSHKRIRTNFSKEQLEEFENTFQLTRYPDRDKLLELSAKVGVPEDKLRTWFQNKRARMKRLLDKMKPGGIMMSESERIAKTDMTWSTVQSVQSHMSSCPIPIPRPPIPSPLQHNSPNSLFTSTQPRSAGCTGNNSTYPTFTYQPNMATSVAATAMRMMYPQPLYSQYMNPMFNSLGLLRNPPAAYDQGQNLQSFFMNYPSPPSTGRMMDPHIASYLSDYYGSVPGQYRSSAPQISPSSLYCTPPYSPPYRRDISSSDFMGGISPSCDYASQYCKPYDRGFGNAMQNYQIKSPENVENLKLTSYKSQNIFHSVSPCSSSGISREDMDGCDYHQDDNNTGRPLSETSFSHTGSDYCSESNCGLVSEAPSKHTASDCYSDGVSRQEPAAFSGHSASKKSPPLVNIIPTFPQTQTQDEKQNGKTDQLGQKGNTVDATMQQQQQSPYLEDIG